MTLLFVYLFTALITSFICSILESVLLSLPRSYLKAQSELGKRSAETFLKLKDDIDKPLSAILSLNTVAHTVGAAGVGAQATVVFGEAYFGVVSAILTLLILVLTEIVPKTLGANYSRELMGIAGRAITVTIFITYPLVLVSAFLTRLLSRKDVELTTSREEISALANIGTEEGIFLDKENKIIQNLIRLKSIRVVEVMTPRVVVVVASEDMTLEEFLKVKDFLHFSRIPIFKDHHDNITGYVFREQVFENLAEDKFKLALKDIKREILTISEFTTLFDAWENLIHGKEHIALVADEYGGMDGIITLEDIIETLLGFEILDEKDKIEDMQKFARERWEAKRKKYRLLTSEPDGSPTIEQVKSE
ncbi:MAG TPA: CNNM domain-containing protein [Pyrinomonadaceae bacterium]|nr:CNNM domain-containing protein [Pyrinomonadaceae bacterium]HMP66480.1 CNNM domain-containing protein [Pyrinomonadaceae bacterium]